MSKKYIIVKNLNNTYSVKHNTGRFYKLWTNPVTNKMLVFADQYIAEYWAGLPNNYSIPWESITGTIDYYI